MTFEWKSGRLATVLAASGIASFIGISLSEFGTNNSLAILGATLFLLLPALVFMLLNRSVIIVWSALLPLLYLRNDPLFQVGWMIVFLPLALVEAFGYKWSQRLATSEWLHLAAIACLALMGFALSNRGPDAMMLLVGTYLLPPLIYVCIRMLPRGVPIEGLVPRLFVLVYALIGVGSIVYKLGNPSQDRVAGYLQLSVTMIGYSSATLVPIALYYLAKSRHALVEGLVFLFLMLTLILTNTRMALPMAAIGFLSGARYLRKFLMPAIVLGLIIAVLGTELMFTRFQNLGQSELDISLIGRLIAWNAGIELIQSHPWTGIGMGEFSKAYQQITAMPLLRLIHGHNVLLQLAADLGIPGALLYLLFLARRIRIGFRLVQDDLGRALAWAVSIYLIAGSIESIFFRPEWTLFYWVLLACLDRIVDRESDNRTGNPTAGDPGSPVGKSVQAT